MNAYTTTSAVSSFADSAFVASASTGSAAHGAALLRLSLGVMWLAHALLKLFVFTLPGTAAYFESIGFPGWVAYPVFMAEVLGGIALVIGFYARQTTLLLVPVMAVAAWVHAPNGWVHTSAGGGWEYPVFLIAASIALWLIGDGSFALRRSARFTFA
ncbi:putative oxidoreductase [Noviherbaspirillum humi]|uniref:Putative oxidoreductase n=1 Tax=Noviherbaspirillum humi TaxID=1688639 RepID=A0A239I8R5_9BURK|nr:DoxX family protein [Noviherbaspirillum humi]SNS90216.1 putative oxidoreductase [Noviherbaspirillum humi]